MTTTEKFIERARAVSARVSIASGMAEAERIAKEVQDQLGEGGAGVVHAALGIAATGTCVVDTDDEQTRLATMLPETTVIILRAADIVPGLADAAQHLRERQRDGRIAYTSFITGPSRTADIERVAAIGVHGPLDVYVIVVVEEGRQP